MALNKFVAIDGSDIVAPTPPDVIGVLGTAEDGGLIATTFRDVPRDDPEYPDAVVQWMYVRGFVPVDHGTLKGITPGPTIVGNPISDDEVERGARVTNKSMRAELAVWGDIAELQPYALEIVE